MPAASARRPPEQAGCCRWLARHGGGPEEAGEFAGGGDGRDIAWFAAAAKALLESVEAVLGAPGDLEDMRGLTCWRFVSVTPIRGSRK